MPYKTYSDKLRLLVKFVTEDGISLNSFLCIIENVGYTKDKLSEADLYFLQKHGLKLNNCKVNQMTT